MMINSRRFMLVNVEIGDYGVRFIYNVGCGEEYLTGDSWLLTAVSVRVRGGVMTDLWFFQAD